ncbi:hypothetical protein [Candidatus Palauibacter sp.]|uniref:hypothetical protein n=1 Tax=Candidatus Palauibacter sp. TaxID=3101350 RepID=UPI003B51EF4E
MREAARGRFGNDSSFLIGINGSYARREATTGSDVDFFFLAANADASLLKDEQAVFREIVKADLNMELPASNGIFETPLPTDEICEIGGPGDNNETLTRRMLLLLEGEWVFNESAFHDVRDSLLKRYLYDRLGEDKICMFLLNDIIRYWRTICIDLEYKAYAENKVRETRLIKLRFSRMLLYASGVLAIGQGHGLSYEAKLESLRSLFQRYPINRIRSVVGDGAAPVLDLYAEFLEALDTPSIRDSLDSEGPDGQHFVDMSKKAGQFRDRLRCLLQGHFTGDNPTIRALLL